MTDREIVYRPLLAAAIERLAHAERTLIEAQALLAEAHRAGSRSAADPGLDSQIDRSIAIIADSGTFIRRFLGTIR